MNAFIEHHQQAIRYYQQSLTLLHSVGNTSGAARTFDSLGHPHVALSEHEQARVAWREALQLYREQGRDIEAERIQQQLDTLDQQMNIK